MRIWAASLGMIGACATLTLAQAAQGNDELFGKLDANGDGFVSKDEVQEGQLRLFERLLRTSDKDGDGKLSKTELIAGTSDAPEASDSLPPIEGERSRQGFDFAAMLKRRDANGDGKLAKDEVPERMQPYFEKLDANRDEVIDGEELKQAGRRLAGAGQVSPSQIAERVFAERDANKDGKITADEMPADRRETFKQMLSKVDEDGDGAITKEQFVKAISAMQASSGVRPDGVARGGGELLRRLKDADANGDGKLSREEAPERVVENFDRIDTNGDGQIDEIEIRRMVERFRNARPQN